MSGLPAGWQMTELGEVADLGSGGTPKADIADYYGGSIPWAVIGDLNDGFVGATARTITDAGLSNSSAKMVDDHAVLVAMYGSIGKLGLPAIPMATNQAIAFVRPKRGVMNRRYLFYYLLHTRPALAAAGKGATQQNISQTVLKAWPIPLAPPAQQARIVAAIEEQFSRLDAGVAALDRVMRNLRQMRSSALNCLFRSLDGDDWPMVDMGDVVTKARYGTSTKCAFDGTGLPVLRIPNIQNRTLSFEGMKFASDPSVDLSSALVSEDDILIIRTNGSRSLIGRAALVRRPAQPTAFASYLIQLRPNSTIISPAYLVAILAAPSLRRRIEGMAATTAGQYNISLSKLRTLQIPLPPLDKQVRLLAGVEHRISLAEQMELAVYRALAMSCGLRSAILEAAFSGVLVPQDPNDEPASALLERIEVEHASSNGKIATKTRGGRRRKATA
jgi:type I restriction enzyme, S subunit